MIFRLLMLVMAVMYKPANCIGNTIDRVTLIGIEV